MIDIDKVIILENEEEYLVLDKVNYENIEYYYNKQKECGILPHSFYSQQIN